MEIRQINGKILILAKKNLKKIYIHSFKMQAYVKKSVKLYSGGYSSCNGFSWNPLWKSAAVHTCN